MITAIIFIIVLSVIVFAHELGHFVMAKRAGMKVEEFGFGFPPRVWRYKPKHSETTYSINVIPFGGFVKIQGENDDERGRRSFAIGSFWARSGVILAGVIMNVILAMVLLAMVSAIGSRPAVIITGVAVGSPAQQAGLKLLDEITGFENVEVTQAYIAEHKGEEIMLSVRRRGDLLEFRLTPRVNPPPGEGAIGIALAQAGAEAVPIHRALWEGIKNGLAGLWFIITGFGMIIKNIFLSGRTGVELAGPVGIAVATGQQARLGFTYLLQFMAFISLNLAVINAVPFPALDGGRFLFLIIEKIKGSPLPRRVENGFNTVGFVLLLLLMFFITAKDVLKFL